MGKAIATGELIRISEIAADAALCERLPALVIGDGITLEVGGVRGGGRECAMRLAAMLFARLET